MSLNEDDISEGTVVFESKDGQLIRSYMYYKGGWHLVRRDNMSLYEEAWEKLRARILPSHDPNCWHSAKKILKMMDECLGEAEEKVEAERLKLKRKEAK